MITRNTIRFDGKTVGQAMDEDSAFLRSIGIPVKDGAKTWDEKKEDFKEEIRMAVLNALDNAVKNGKGWEDGDLSKLFPVIDDHAEQLFFRMNHLI